LQKKWLEETVMGHGSIGLLQARFLRFFRTPLSQKRFGDIKMCPASKSFSLKDQQI